MRIFQVLNAAATGGISSSNIWLRNLYEPLLDLGHDVVLFRGEQGVPARKNPVLRAEISQKLLEAFRTEHARKPIDLFFTYLMDDMVETGVLDEIRRIGVPTCNFSCNNTHQFDLVDEISSHFDYNLHSEKDAAGKFKAIGAYPVWFPMAANPKYYRPVDLPREFDLTFVGQNYARRQYYIWQLLEQGIDIHVFGPGWLLRHDAKTREVLRTAKRTSLALQSLFASGHDRRAASSARLLQLDHTERLRKKYALNLHHPVTDDEMVNLYSRSTVSLGFLEVYDSHDSASILKQHLHLRDFEAPMCGACYLTGYSDELAGFYEPDTEVLVYRNEHELLDKARFYISHPAEAERVRNAGLMRALRDHTYQNRFTSLFRELSLK